MDPTTFRLLWNSTEMIKFKGSKAMNPDTSGPLVKTLTFPPDIQKGDILVVVQRCVDASAFKAMPGFTTLRVDDGLAAPGRDLLLSMEMKIAVGGETGTFPVSSSSGSGQSAATFLHFKPLVNFTSFAVSWGGYIVSVDGTSLNTSIVGLGSPGLLLAQMSCLASQVLEGRASSTPVIPFIAPSAFNRVFYKTYPSSPTSNTLFSLTDTGTFNAIQGAYITLS
jgi:hypothetical protein